jgi:hypothetical protein
MIRISIGFIGLTLLLSGCGRVSTVTNSGTTRQSRPWADVSVGDCVEYRFDNTMTTDMQFGKLGSQGTGHRTTTITEGGAHGRSVPSWLVRTFEVREDQVVTLHGGSESRTILTWLGADASGNLYLLGEAPDGSNWSVVTDSRPPLWMPAEVKPGSTWSYIAHFANGDTESCEYRYVGSEVMKTPVGDLNAVKVSCTFARSGASMSGYEWFSPSIPVVFEVRQEVTRAQQIGGITMRGQIVASIESAHVAR